MRSFISVIICQQIQKVKDPQIRSFFYYFIMKNLTDTVLQPAFFVSATVISLYYFFV